MNFECENCKKKFTTKRRLINHKQKMNECIKNDYCLSEIEENYMKDNYKCLVCGKVYFKEYNLTRHQWKDPTSQCYVKK